MSYNTNDLVDPRPLRQEMYLASLNGLYDGDLPLPVTKEDAHLYYLALKARIEAEGGSLPEGSSPNQYLITDSEGVAGWAERLAWKEETENILLPETETEIENENKDYTIAKTRSAPFFPDAFTDLVLEIDGVKTVVNTGERWSDGYMDYYNIGNSDVDSTWYVEGDLPYHVVITDGGAGNTYVGVYLRSKTVKRVKLYQPGETIHPISEDLIPDTIARTSDIPEGMPTLAEDGSDAGKTVKANAEGTGYELVSESGGFDFVSINEDDLLSSEAVDFACSRTPFWLLIHGGLIYTLTLVSKYRIGYDECLGGYYLELMDGTGSALKTVTLEDYQYTDIVSCWGGE